MDLSRTSDPHGGPGMAASAAARGFGLAPWVGSCAGLATTALLAALIPPTPDPNLPPGFAAATQLDIRRQILLFAGAIALALAGGALGNWWARRGHGANDSRTNETPSRPAAPPAVSLWLAVSAIAAHALTVWTFLLSAAPKLTVEARGSYLLAGASLASAGLAALLGRGRIARGVSFLGAASPVLLVAFAGTRPLPFAGLALAGAFLLPVLARVLWWRDSEPPPLLRRMTVGFLLPVSFVAVSAVTILGAPRVSGLFEDGHALLPASEYLRGELPYRDIVPGHGLLSDGLFQAASLRVFGDDLRGFSRGQKVLGAFFWPSLYALGFAATGSAAVGFATLSFSFLLFPQYAFPRVIASLIVVALATGASRTGKAWAWRACGLALPLAVFLSVDFATYAAGAVATAWIVARGDRRRHARAFLSGALLAGAASLTALAAAGILPDFLRTTLRFIPSLFPVYAQGFPPLSASAYQIEVNALPGYAAYGIVALALVILGAQLPRGAGVSDGARAALPILAWMVLAMLSVAERHHFGYVFFGLPAAAVLVARWLAAPSSPGGGNGSRPLRVAAAGALVVVLAVPHRPLALVAAVEYGIRNPTRPPGTWALAQPRRAGGGLLPEHDRDLVLRTAEMMRQARFAQGDTWIDFVNAPGLYFLFERPCPIRYYEVPFYESEAAQTEVIDAISRNPHVRAALVAGPEGEIDGIPNAQRAPRVYAYLRAHFRPFLREGGIEFWIREPAPE